jgi:hypothetical protein
LFIRLLSDVEALKGSDWKELTAAQLGFSVKTILDPVYHYL